MQITFWQNMPSHHMAPVQRALADIPEVHVRVIFAEDISKTRLELGWSTPDLGGAETHSIGGDAELLTKLAKASEGVNLIGGLGGQFNNCVLNNLPRNADGIVGLLLERGVFVGGLKDHLRPWYHRVRLHSIRQKFDLIFAFGSLGVGYYSRLGVPNSKIFPFQYPCNSGQVNNHLPASHPPHLIYVGRLSYRKGVDLLPNTLKILKSYDWDLTIVGEGPLEGQIREQFDRYNLSPRVRWLGTIASERVASVLCESDLCIVPSRHDGWGMAVSEAIEAGLCVVATPTVGAKDFIADTEAGTVSRDVTADSLANALRPYLDDPKMITSAKRTAFRARDHFRGKAIAEYIVLVLKHIKGEASAPPAPWEQAAFQAALNNNYSEKVATVKA